MKRDSITIVLVPETRRPLTLEFSVMELLLVCVLLAAVFISAGYSIYSFRGLRSEYSSLTSNLYTLKAELKEKEFKLQGLKKELESKKGLILLVNGSQDTTALGEILSSPEIRIEDLRVDTRDSGLALAFRLVNTTDDEHVLTGHLMVIAEHSSGEFNLYGTFPVFNLSAEQPVVFSLGESYSIRRFKQVEAVVPLKDEPGNYNSFKILAFNENGQVMLNESRVLRW